MYSKDHDWAGTIAEKIYAKVKMSVSRSGDKIPYLTEDGIFDDQSGQISWWTNGFYAGQLWQLYHAYGDDIFRRTAERIEDKLDAGLMDCLGLDHDSGFKWLLTSVANYRLTKSERSKNRGLLAASNLAGRFNPAGRFLRALEEKRTNWDTGVDYILENGSVAYHDEKHNFPIVYGDYFFTEAIFKLCGKELFLW